MPKTIPPDFEICGQCKVEFYPDASDAPNPYDFCSEKCEWQFEVDEDVISKG